MADEGDVREGLFLSFHCIPFGRVPPHRTADSSLLTVLLAVVVSLSAHPIICDSLFVHEGIDNFLWLNFGILAEWRACVSPALL